MPYIEPCKRPPYDAVLEQITEFSSKGELEYCIFKLMKMYMRSRPGNYSNNHDTVYAAQHCADEFRRRFLDKREDTAMSINGDVDDGIS